MAKRSVPSRAKNGISNQHETKVLIMKIFITGIAFSFATLTSGLVWAQTPNVTLYGIADATFQLGYGSVSNKTQLGSSGYNTSRIGMRGHEDLGGGLTAGFVLEAGYDIDTGAGTTTNPNNQGVFNPATGKFTNNSSGGGGLTFGRSAFVSLGGAFGELRLGRDYTPHFSNHLFDPFTINGVGASQVYLSGMGGPTRVRASNAIGYILPKGLNGLYGKAQYYMGENSKNDGLVGKNDGSGGGIRVGYAADGLDVAVAVGETKFHTPGNIRSINIGSSYDFKSWKLHAVLMEEQVKNSAKGRGYLVGVSIPVGVGMVRASYSSYSVKYNADGRHPKSDKFSLGYVHNLSKRTALYGAATLVLNKKGAAYAVNDAVTEKNKNSSGYDFGIRHIF